MFSPTLIGHYCNVLSVFPVDFRKNYLHIVKANGDT